MNAESKLNHEKFIILFISATNMQSNTYIKTELFIVNMIELSGSTLYNLGRAQIAQSIEKYII